MSLPEYKAKAKLYIGDRIINKGEVFTSDEPAGRQWLPLNEAAKKQAAKIKKSGLELAIERARGESAAPSVVTPNQNSVANLGGSNEDLTEEEKEAKIAEALAGMDHNNDDQWTVGGDPKVEHIINVVGFDLKRADIKAVNPSFVRVK